MSFGPAGAERLPPALIKLQSDLLHLGLRWALVGGLAVSVRGEPRTTHDLDVTIFVVDDGQAESTVQGLTSRGYRFHWAREHEHRQRLMFVRMLTAGPELPGITIDLMFASSGIEEEIVATAEMLEVLPGVVVPVATTAHLLALKVLAGRSRDVTDFATLTRYATAGDLHEARAALALIARRGFDRGKDLQVEFVRLMDRAPGEV